MEVIERILAEQQYLAMLERRPRDASVDVKIAETRRILATLAGLIVDPSPGG